MVQSSHLILYISQFFSHEDGKPEIVRTAKEIYFNHLHSNNINSDSTTITNSNKTIIATKPFENGDNENNEEEGKANHISNLITDEDEESVKKSIQDADESKIDLVLNKAYSWPVSIGTSTEPDLLIILGNISSTLGFLPWHIRLTEIHWLPKLQIVETNDFLQVLRQFSGCQQRYGT